MAELDEALVGRVLEVEPVGFSGKAYRHLGPGYQPLSGEGARVRGGRWNPTESFPVVYLAKTERSAIAEFYRLAEKNGRRPGDLLPRHLHRYRVELQRVLDLTVEDNLRTVRLELIDLRSEDPTRCQAVGDAAHYAGFEAVLAPSATGIDETLAVFTARLQAGSLIEPIAFDVRNDLPLHHGGGR